MKFILSFLFLVQILHANDCSHFFHQSKSLKEIRNIIVKNENTLNAIDFERLTLDDLKKYFLNEYTKTEDKIHAIINSSAKPSFNNTIVSLEKADIELARVISIAYHIDSVATTTDTKKFLKLIKTLMSELSDKIYYNKVLYEKVNRVHESNPQLSFAETKLLNKTLNTFKANGINLPSKNQERLSQINIEIMELNQKFAENVLEHEKQIKLFLNEEELKGVPQDVVESAEQLAKKDGHSNKFLFSPQYNNDRKLLEYADDEAVRKKAYDTTKRTASEGPFNNIPVLKEIVTLRNEKAKILGQDSYAQLIAQRNMAKSEENILRFIESTQEFLEPLRQKEKEELDKFVERLRGFKAELEPWNKAYYIRKYSEALNQFEEEEVRPYFELENTLAGIFKIVEDLYSVEFSPINIPNYSPDVRTFLVKDLKSKQEIGLFYYDPYARTGKSGGAWSTDIRSQHKLYKDEVRPLVVNNLNIIKPKEGSPTLLTLSEVQTTLHELGHGLHALFSDVKFISQSTTRVPRDFVEVPSTFMENFLYNKTFLEVVSKHYQTGESLPNNLINKIIDSRKNRVATYISRQLSLALLDMKWHSKEALSITDIKELENLVFKRTKEEAQMDISLISPVFNHIFEDGYAALYYSYQWSEVMQANIFYKFLEAGVFNPENANRLRKLILSKGGSIDHLEKLTQYLEHAPDSDALLKLYGLK